MIKIMDANIIFYMFQIFKGHEIALEFKVSRLPV